MNFPAKKERERWCYLCKLKILSSSYGSSRAATNAFQELKIVKFADPFETLVFYCIFMWQFLKVGGAIAPLAPLAAPPLDILLTSCSVRINLQSSKSRKYISKLSKLSLLKKKVILLMNFRLPELSNAWFQPISKLWPPIRKAWNTIFEKNSLNLTLLLKGLFRFGSL